MTNKVALISLLGFGPDNDSVDRVMIEFDIIPSDVYTKSLSVTLKTAAIQLMQLLLTTADTKNENGYDIKYDRPTILKRIDQLKDEIGVEDNSRPTINARQLW